MALTFGDIATDAGIAVPLTGMDFAVRWHINVQLSDGRSQWITVLRDYADTQDIEVAEARLKQELQLGLVQFATKSRYRVVGVNEIGTVGFEPM